jgi:hypothetical protein
MKPRVLVRSCCMTSNSLVCARRIAKQLTGSLQDFTCRASVLQLTEKAEDDD